jgi:hypothetical protein
MIKHVPTVRLQILDYLRQRTRREGRKVWNTHPQMILCHEKMEVPLLWQICRKLPLDHLEVRILEYSTKPCPAPIIAWPDCHGFQTSYPRKKKPRNKPVKPVPEPAITVYV